MKIATCSWLRFLSFLGMTKVILTYSAKEKLFNEQDETPVPLLEWNEYDANRWNLFDRWRFSSPLGREHARATSALTEENGETPREVMVMYGGILYEADDITWTYDPHFDTWEAHRSGGTQICIPSTASDRLSHTGDSVPETSTALWRFCAFRLKPLSM